MPPPYNPNLPQNPQQWAQQQQGFNTPAYSSHYMQAYMQAQPGYYQQPQQQAPYGQAPPSYHNNFAGPSSQPFHQNYQHQYNRPSSLPPTGQWYQPGNKRCTYQGCSFSGSPSSVEIHMMDRHLIYPPGWDKRKQKQDWDADPSLKGKPIPIQGTNIMLDDPEQLAAWVAERKNRFPTSHKVQDKKRKMEEAIARGQLTAEDMGMRSDKRRRTDEQSGRTPQSTNHPNNIGGRGRGGGRGNQFGAGGRGRGRGGGSAGASASASSPASLPPKPTGVAGLPPKPPAPIADIDNDYDSNASDSDDGEPEVVSSKVAPVPTMEPPPEDGPQEEKSKTTETSTSQEAVVQKQPQRRPAPQPKRPPRNPFAERPSLLRNLILPEIRVTVSNLSQAIRFLVDNDFLRGVELKPGQASEAKIQVLESTKNEAPVTKDPE